LNFHHIKKQADIKGSDAKGSTIFRKQQSKPYSQIFANIDEFIQFKLQSNPEGGGLLPPAGE